MFIATLALVLGISALIWWAMKPSKAHMMLAKIPGPTAIPIFGNSLQLKSDNVEFFQQLMDYCDQYAPTAQMYKLFFGTQPMIIVFNASAAEKILSSMKVLSKAFTYNFIMPWLQTGLLTSTGAKWQSRRKMLTPTFHFKILADFLHVFNEQADVFVRCLEEKCDGAPFDIFPFITHCALDIICETAMGKKLGAQTGSGDSAYIEAVYGMSDLIMIRMRSPWEWSDFIYRNTKRGQRHDAYLTVLKGFTRDVINERKAEMEESQDSGDTNPDQDSDVGTKKRRAFLDLLLHMTSETNLSIDDIQEEVDTFMFEGHDTTAAGMAWAIQLIGSHPDVQKKLHEEMDEVFRDSNRPATTEDLTKMKYLECVLKESLRILPSVPAIGRILDEDADIDGIELPKGASVMIMIKKINMDPKYFPDPEKFNPDRFLPDNAAGRHPYTYIPFSAGPRNCIGQRFAMNEEKCVLSAVLRNFTIESTQTIEEIRPMPDLILRPTKGIDIKLAKRLT